MTPTPHPFSSFPFTAGQIVEYVCYGQDPSYAKVTRPQFVVKTAKLTSVGKKTFKFEDTVGRHDIAHFDDRTAANGDSQAIDRIIKVMAIQAAGRFLGMADPKSGWPADKKDCYRAISEQFEAGDYDVIREA